MLKDDDPHEKHIRRETGSLEKHTFLYFCNKKRTQCKIFKTDVASYFRDALALFTLPHLTYTELSCQMITLHFIFQTGVRVRLLHAKFTELFFGA